MKFKVETFNLKNSYKLCTLLMIIVNVNES